MKILIIKVSALGDVIHALPVLAYLHGIDLSGRSGESIQIDWLVEEGFAPVLAGHPLIERVIPLQTKRWRELTPLAMLKEMWSFTKELRQQRYDFVFDLQGNSKSGLFTRLSRSSKRYGFDRHHVREWPNLLATNHHVHLSAADHHVSQRSIAVVAAALPEGCERVNAGPLQVLPIARQHVLQQIEQQNLSDKKLAVLHYGTTWKTKLWNLEHWQQLAAKLVENTDVVPLLTWGNDQEHQAAQLIAEHAAGKAIVWPRGSLPELVALLDRANVVVGCDTGPIHIAAALGTATVSIFRVTEATRNGPMDENHRCLQSALPCSPCLLKQCERDDECSKSIAVDDVYTAILELIST
ncbi:MAG: lipopolysaccharide heptosyltransferase I [Desulfobacteraceae bacterium 4572_35.2]|nr:MAG: lipopolysaccharide heptosyltransferase I [Desulfobacteraceae bacterium 4572_35.2]